MCEERILICSRWLLLTATEESTQLVVERQIFFLAMMVVDTMILFVVALAFKKGSSLALLLLAWRLSLRLLYSTH